MNKRWLYLLWAFLLVAVIPGVLVAIPFGNSELNVGNMNLQLQETKEPVEDTKTPTNEPIVQQISVLMSNNEITQMPLEEYVLCVVLGEIPAWFESEAIKAQAVVARTYTLRRINGNTKHPQAAVCTDSACCQSFRTPKSFLADGGDEKDLNKIINAVSETENKVLVYKGKLIEATYFSCSGGVTEDAAAVWGEDIPYLRSTASPGEENAVHHIDNVYFTAAEFEKKIGIDIPGRTETWFGNISYTKGNGVATIEIGGKKYSGTDIRQRLGLRSTAFSVVTIGNTILITTKGYGHRVGMSQYGADAMAVNGKTYRDILAHYYQGTELTTYRG